MSTVSGVFGSLYDPEAAAYAKSVYQTEKNTAIREQERGQSSWQGGDDEVNISEAARKTMNAATSTTAKRFGDPGFATMSATTRQGAQITLEAQEVSSSNFTMGKFAKQNAMDRPFDFSMSQKNGSGSEGPEMMYTLSIIKANGEQEKHVITNNTRLREDEAGNITIEEQTDGPLVGADGQDILINIKDGGWVDGGGGDDIVFNLGLDAMLKGGDGNDVIMSMGSGANISGGAGDDAIAVLKDTLHNYKEDRRRDGTGNGTHVVGRPNGFEQVTIDGGDGNDFITTTDLYQSVINGGGGADVIETGNLKKSSINGGDGSDEIRTKGLEGSTISGGAGYDLIDVIGKVSKSSISGDGDDDEINVTGKVENSKVSGGSGHDVIAIKAGSGENAGIHGSKIIGGDGDDVLSVNGSITGSVIDAGKGDDFVWVKGTATDTQIYGGEGDDTIYVDKLVNSGREGASALVDGGKGNDNIYVGTSKSGEIHGGDGDDFIAVGKADSNPSGKPTVIDGGQGQNGIFIENAKDGTEVRNGQILDAEEATRWHVDRLV